MGISFPNARLRALGPHPPRGRNIAQHYGELCAVRVTVDSPGVPLEGQLRLPCAR